MALRSLTSRALARCTVSSACCSTSLISTKRSLSQPAASQIAAASLLSFLSFLRYTATNCGAISRGSWPSFLNSRAQ